MTDVVSVTDFRNNIFDYVGYAGDSGVNLTVTRGQDVIGWFVPKVKQGKEARMGRFLREIKAMQKKYPFEGGKDLSLKIDEYIYGKK